MVRCVTLAISQEQGHACRKRRAYIYEMRPANYICNETHKRYGIRPTTVKRDLIANVVVCDSCHVSTVKPHVSKETCVCMKRDPRTIYGTRHIHTRQKRPNCKCCGMWFMSYVDSEAAHVKKDVWISEMRPTKNEWNKTHAHKTKEAYFRMLRYVTKEAYFWMLRYVIHGTRPKKSNACQKRRILNTEWHPK